MFLTREELVELTGWKHTTKICDHLAKLGYFYDVDKDGWPKVLRIALMTRHNATEKKRPKLRLT